MAYRPSAKTSLDELDLEQLRCRGLRHAWEDVDMVPMIWGIMHVEHWRLRCMRCNSVSTEYRDPVTCERIGRRQYQLAPGYSLAYRYANADYFVELRTRRLSTPGLRQKHSRALRALDDDEGGSRKSS